MRLARRSCEYVLCASFPYTGSMPGHPVWGTCTSKLLDIARLLVVLCQAEADRLRVWARPLASPILSSSSSTNTTSTASTGQRGLSLSVEQLHTAWQVHPRLAVAVAGRQVLVPAGSSTRGELVKLLAANAWDPRVQCIPEAAMLLVQASSAGDAGLHALATWAVAGGVDGLQLMAGPLADASPAVKAYAIRCLHAAHPEKLAFFLPQLVQSLRHDKDGTLTAFLKVRRMHGTAWDYTQHQPPAPHQNTLFHSRLLLASHTLATITCCPPASDIHSMNI